MLHLTLCGQNAISKYSLLRNSLGLPDLSCVIDGRVSNFMDKLIDNSDFTVVLQKCLFTICVSLCVCVCVCVCVFVRVCICVSLHLCVFFVS